MNTFAKILTASNLRILYAEELSTHGGSPRVYGCHEDDNRDTKTPVKNILNDETECGLQQIDTYLSFQPRAYKIKNKLLSFLLEQKKNGKNVVVYGAEAKGNTLLNYAGVKPDLLPFVCDAAPAKQGKFMPGSHIPIRPPRELAGFTPDNILILPWNIADEVRKQNAEFGDRGVKFVKAVPTLAIE